jgi:predicted nucleic acid-binding protein
VVLVDTSAWIHALRPGGSAAVQAVLRPIIVGREAAVTEWIVLELMTGLRKGDSKPGLLRWFEPISRLPGPSDAAEWEQVWEHAALLRRRGISITAAACLIASIAVRHGVALAHCDRDFEAMRSVLPLETLDWTSHVAGQERP